MQQIIHNNRKIFIEADGARLDVTSRVHLTGSTTLGLLPTCWRLSMPHLPQDLTTRFRNARCLRVLDENGALLAAGRREEVFTTLLPDDTPVTEVLFSEAPDFLRATVDLNLPAGLTATELLRQVVAGCSAPVPVCGLPVSTSRLPAPTVAGRTDPGAYQASRDAPLPVTTRGSVFHGRARDAVTDLARSAGLVPYLEDGCLSLADPAAPGTRLTFGDSDLQAPPALISTDRGSPEGVLLRVSPAAFPLGRPVQASWNGETFRGALVARALDLDTWNGPWQATLLLSDT